MIPGAIAIAIMPPKYMPMEMGMIVVCMMIMMMLMGIEMIIIRQ
jgi:hypothetical protein